MLTVSASATHAQSLKVGARAPEIDLPAIAGGRVKLSALRGHPVVVTFWQTWCPSCRTEFPELINAYRGHAASGLEVIAVNDPAQEHSSGDGTKHVRQFIDELAVPFVVVLDKRGRVRDAYGILTLPTTLFIDSAGVVQAVNRGPTSREELERGIASILSRGGLE